MPKQRGGSKATPSQRGGGSIGQSIKYVDPSAPEQTAFAGGDLLKATPLIARPAIGGGTRKRKGGFYPSVMAGVVDNALLVGPLAAFAGRKLMSRKSRKGGGKKGNIWKAQQEEAKAALVAIPYAKPTAQNISKYAAAKRRGSLAAQEFFDAFRERVEQKQAAKKANKEARQKARESKKAAKKAEKNEAKAAKALERAAAKEAKAATKKAKLPRAKATKKNERAPSNLQLRRLAEANAAAAQAAMKESLKNEQAAWKELISQAKARLATEGKATQKNTRRLATLMKEGKNTTAFLNEFRARPQTVKKRTVKATATSSSTTTTTTAATTAAAKRRTKKNKTVAATTTAAPKRLASESQQAYFKALSNARTFLGTVGAPKAENMSKYASMVVQKAKEKDSEKLKTLEKTMKNWVENFKTRRPLSMAKPAKTTKAKTPKKALTTVKENNTNTESSTNTEDSMQGYSENFEPESETENKNEN